MARKQNNLLKRRIIGAYLSSVISIALVLLLIGIASMLIVNAKGVSDYFKENVRVSVIFKPKTTQAQAMKYQQQMECRDFVRTTHLVTVEEGTKDLVKMLGEDFLSVFATNPVPLSVDVTLKAEYVSADSLEYVQKVLADHPLVDEVSCQQSLVATLEQSIARISFVLSIFTILMLFISVVLIANTVRLSIYSHRFTIHTMQLVGATRRFITTPYLIRAAIQGLFSALLAIIVLVTMMFVLRSSFAQIFELFSAGLLLKVMAIVLICGVVICTVSTFFVVARITTLSKDELYG